MLLILFLACSSSETPLVQAPASSPASGHEPQRVEGHGPNNAPGMSMKEDLSSSWRAELAVSVQSTESENQVICPDGALWVPGGPFLMGSSSDHAGRDESPVHVVQVSGFCLDRVERFDEVSGRPVEGLSWEEALAICQEQEGRLPTEAEWEKAARGGCELGRDPQRCDPSDLRPYPWGEQAPDCTLANHQATQQGRPKLCEGKALAGSTLSTGPYGHLGLAGNLWEWTADAYHPKTYGDGEVRVNPLGPREGAVKVLRGGGWNTFSTNMRVANRFTSNLEGSATGVRCAYGSLSGNYDALEAIQWVTLSGMVEKDAGGLKGPALMITAFDAEDADPKTGRVAPGRSPVAEIKLIPNGASHQNFSLELPAGRYLLMGALDGGVSSTQNDQFTASSGMGGFGQVEGIVDASASKSGLQIKLRSAPPPPGGGPPGGLR